MIIIDVKRHKCDTFYGMILAFTCGSFRNINKSCYQCMNSLGASHHLEGKEDTPVTMFEKFLIFMQIQK
jgi:hypothetical protein